MPDPDNDELGVWDAGDDLGPIPPRDPQTALVRHAATNLADAPAYHGCGTGAGAYRRSSGRAGSGP